MKSDKISFFWFRRDFSLHDNAGLFHALKSGKPILPIFIFDTEILDKLEIRSDKRVQFIYDEVSRLKSELEKLGSSFLVKIGKPTQVWKEIADEFNIDTIFANRDYEPYGRQRDKELYQWFQSKNISFRGYKNQVIFEKSEVVKEDGTPYLVFTPYMKKWKSLCNEFYLKSYPSEKYFQFFYKTAPFNLPTIEDIGFEQVKINVPSREFDNQIIDNYDQTRDFPSVKGTSRLSLHLRFGTISIRQLARFAYEHNEKYLNELIWREFYMMILYHFPTSVNKAIKPKYDRIEWENSEKQFEKWCAGRTGIPIVDAGMRELNSTGYMHNRVRMIVASFLTKNLLIDWRWGEAYFASKLLDYEQSSNVGGWQWACGSGCDAAPYFRIFNPTSQQEKFDPQLVYIKKWVPEFATSSYPKPIVDLKQSRVRALARYKEALNN